MNHHPPYLWMDSRRYGSWLELSADDSHGIFATWARKICGECSGTIVDEYPAEHHSGEKEYWRLKTDNAIVLLMRKSGMGTALGGDPAVLVRIAEQLGIRTRIGWRWKVWELKETWAKARAFFHS